MTFTFIFDLSIDRDYVRFHTGDTSEAEAYLSDELITSLISETGSKQQAVIAGLRYIITKLSKPNVKADWLQVDNKTAREGYEVILRNKLKEFGIGMATATHIPVSRLDEEE